eukprot:TRINITY_DN18541_c0_g2_i1.p1 TRINITY_DN18541_c0_g2~~TRINITY_DN18541_c0_g2_i1.p1  ORF type:complete len:192 (-),score=30.68 TRINITY_DN18541_c0_g2_i1:184-759(-)
MCRRILVQGTIDADACRPLLNWSRLAWNSMEQISRSGASAQNESSFSVMSLSSVETTIATIDVDGEEVQVEIHPVTGPVLLDARGDPVTRPDCHGEGHGLAGHGTCTLLRGEIFGGGRPRLGAGFAKNWKDFTATEKKIAIHIAAKQNKARLALKHSGAKQMECIEKNVEWMSKAAAMYRSSRPPEAPAVT